MGFSLVGNSGDSSSTSNVYETSNTASLNPQNDQQGASTGAFAVNYSPQVVGGGSIGGLDGGINDYYAPVTISSIGTAAGDSALAAATNIADTQAQSIPGASSTQSGGLSSLFSGSWIYWILGALVLLFLAHHKH